MQPNISQYTVNAKADWERRFELRSESARRQTCLSGPMMSMRLGECNLSIPRNDPMAKLRSYSCFHKTGRFYRTDEGRTLQRRADCRFRLPIATHQDNGGVAEDIRMIGREPQRVESVDGR